MDLLHPLDFPGAAEEKPLYSPFPEARPNNCATNTLTKRKRV